VHGIAYTLVLAAYNCRSLDGIYRKHGAVDIAVVGKIAEAVLEGLIYLYDAHRIIHRGK
jgi:mitogen-activated protein kinase kinase